ncbi:MAG TPA: Rnf-Nqr domain containing protein [Steroidobacteraceae bacterium]|nr:Rnf-Nqr domain containing protein [Steroidobacteraceae bacterium]
MSTRPRVFGSTAQLLAVCPLLAMSDTVANALGIGAAVLIVVPLASVVLVLLRSQLTKETALAATMLTVAALVACVELLMSAYLSDMRNALNLFLPLVVSNLIVVHHLQARHTNAGDALIGSVLIAIGIAITLLPLGIARELVGRGSLLHGWSEIGVFRVDMGFMLAMLPPGAFIAFGLLLAARNWLIRPRQ